MVVIIQTASASNLTTLYNNQASKLAASLLFRLKRESAGLQILLKFAVSARRRSTRGEILQIISADCGHPCRASPVSGGLINTVTAESSEPNRHPYITDVRRKREGYGPVEL